MASKLPKLIRCCSLDRAVARGSGAEETRGYEEGTQKDSETLRDGHETLEEVILAELRHDQTGEGLQDAEEESKSRRDLPVLSPREKLPKLVRSQAGIRTEHDYLRCTPTPAACLSQDSNRTELAEAVILVKSFIEQVIDAIGKNKSFVEHFPLPSCSETFIRKLQLLSERLDHCLLEFLQQNKGSSLVSMVQHEETHPSFTMPSPLETVHNRESFMTPSKMEVVQDSTANVSGHRSDDEDVEEEVGVSLGPINEGLAKRRGVLIPTIMPGMEWSRMEEGEKRRDFVSEDEHGIHLTPFSPSSIRSRKRSIDSGEASISWQGNESKRFSEAAVKGVGAKVLSHWSGGSPLKAMTISPVAALNRRERFFNERSFARAADSPSNRSFTRSSSSGSQRSSGKRRIKGDKKDFRSILSSLIRGSPNASYRYVFKVVDEDGVQYRYEPHYDARVYRQRWWDDEEDQYGPNFEDLVAAVCIQKNWIQTPNGFWLPIKSLEGTQILELVEILDACNLVDEQDARGPGAWNPFTSSSNVILSSDRCTVQIGGGRPGLAIAEAGYTRGTHLILLKVLQMSKYCYVGFVELPGDSGVNEVSSLCTMGFAIGGKRMSKAEGGRGSGSPSVPHVRTWRKGVMGDFVVSFQEKDVLGLLLDMDQRELVYYLNGLRVGRVFADLPPGPLFPAAGNHKSGTAACFKACFDVAFCLQGDQILPDQESLVYLGA